MTKTVEKICASCQFYDYHRFSPFGGFCAIDHDSIEKSVSVEPTDSCDQWLEIDDLK